MIGVPEVVARLEELEMERGLKVERGFGPLVSDWSEKRDLRILSGMIGLAATAAVGTGAGRRARAMNKERRGQ